MEVALIFILTLALELFVVLSRIIFGSGKKFWKDRKLPNFHLYYLSVFFLIASFFFREYNLLETALALIIQEAFHHLVVLPLWVGDSEFP